MKGRNALITGGNAGIGYGTAMALANMGYNVYFVAKDKVKAERAGIQIVSATGNKNVHYFIADLSSQKAIKELVRQIKAKLHCIDVLINNAGGVFHSFELSADDLEMTIATNHFSYFLLTNLLLDLIAPGGRIINVSSGAYEQGKIEYESFTQNRSYSLQKAYAQSKLANMLFTLALATRLVDTGITVNCLHPGRVNTDIGNKSTKWYLRVMWKLAMIISRPVDIAEGARTSVYLASSKEVNGLTGKYFYQCVEKPIAAIATNATLQNELWQISAKFCGLAV